MIPGKKYTPEDILRTVWRRKWLLIVPFVVVTLATVVVTFSLPDLYQSEALILVVPQRVPEDYVRPTVTTRIEDRLQTISQQIMSRARLEAIIAEFDLYPRLRESELMEDVVQRMRRDIGINVIRGNAFRISYVSEDRLLAMRVTERLARLFIDESLRDREVLAQGTNQFLQSQLEETRQRLIEHERRLEEYRRAHSGELPSQMEANLTAANNLQLQLQSLNDSLNRDRDRMDTLRRTLEDLQLQNTLAGRPVVDPQEGTTAGELAKAQQALRQMELRLKPEHPDIVRMKRIIRDLEQKAEAEALQAPVSTGVGVASLSPQEKRIAELQSEMRTLQDQINDKEAQAERMRAEMAAYQAKADAAPSRETELIELNRDYETLRRMYADLLQKSQQAQIAADLETRQIGEQFRFLEPPRVPQRPFSPNRAQLNLLGALGGFVLGLGFVALAEYRDTTLKTDEDVVVALSLPVLAMIPMMATTDDVRRRRRRRLALSFTVAIVVLAAAAATVWLVLRA